MVASAHWFEDLQQCKVYRNGGILKLTVNQEEAKEVAQVSMLSINPLMR